MPTPRRSFLGRLAGLLAIGAAPSALAAAAIDAAPRDGAWPDERWLEQLANREHRIIIETGIVADALALRRGLNFLDVLEQDYGIPGARAGLAIGMHSAALAMLLDDAMWAKHGLGARNGLKDGQGAALVANPFRAGAPHTIEALQQRGAHILACDRSMRRLARDLAGAGGDPQAVHRELVAHVLPGVIVTPAMVVALSRAQSRSVPYMAVA